MTSPRTIAEHPPSSRGEDGTQTLELALTLPILLAVVWGLITFGLVFTVDHTLNSAAAEGARAAVSTRTEVEAVAAADAAARAQLANALGGTAAAAQVTAVPGDCVAPAGTRCITVDVVYPWGTDPIVPGLFAIATPDELRSTSTVQLSQ